ncbi:MAG: tRNA epoxyqueuosine(34) reductase QueG [Acidimicrobiales bacterium]
MLTGDYADELCAVGLAAGLDRIGIASAEPFDGTRVVLEQRKAEGLAGSMQFTYRNPARSTDPARALAGVASLVVGARRYDREAPAEPADGRPHARVARYATTDHYGALRRSLDVVADRLRSDGWQARVVLDDNALVDRAAAHRAGIGWFGKNSMVLAPGLGSWVVLGSVLTDAELPVADAPVADGCGSCHRCIDACPTGAIVGPGVVDARRCLAWLVQADGVFPVEHRAALGDRLYGCDDCQEVCPPSRRAPAAAGPDEPADDPGPWVDVLDLLAADDATLLDRYGRFYVPHREPRYLRRNALVVLGNAGRPADPDVAAAVRTAVLGALGHVDPIVRSHAVWAARRLGLDLPADVVAELHGDTDPLVRDELARDVAPLVERR